VTPYLDALPNYRHDPPACLWELLLVVTLLLILRLITMGKRPRVRPLDHFEKTNSTVASQ
jgi:hypothetical protein